MHPEETADNANLFIQKYCAKYKRTPFTIACKRCMIWDNKTKSKDLSIKEKQAKRTMHVVCEKGREQDTAPYIQAWLKSKFFNQFSNTPMLYVPNFSHGNGKGYNEKFGRAVQKHMQLTAFGTRTSVSPDFDNIDSRCQLLAKNPSLRQLVLAMQTRPHVIPDGATMEPPLTTGGTPPVGTTTPPTPPPTPPTGPLFLSIDPATRHTDRSSFVVTYTIGNATEAEEKLKNLPSYLIHEHGESATYWFRSGAIERADSMTWDDINDRPITAEEMELDDLLDEDMDWVANLETADITFCPQVEITLARPSLLNKVSNNPFLGECDSVKTFYAVNNLPTNKDGDTGNNRTAEIVDNTCAGGLEGPSANLV
jgi:hypothetical protein